MEMQYRGHIEWTLGSIVILEIALGKYFGRGDIYIIQIYIEWTLENTQIDDLLQRIYLYNIVIHRVDIRKYFSRGDIYII